MDKQWYIPLQPQKTFQGAALQCDDTDGIVCKGTMLSFGTRLVGVTWDDKDKGWVALATDLEGNLGKLTHPCGFDKAVMTALSNIRRDNPEFLSCPWDTREVALVQVASATYHVLLDKSTDLFQKYVVSRPN